MEKICNKCGVEKDVSEFNKRKDSKDGYRNECKDCRNKNSKKWYNENVERRKIVGDCYRKNNKEKVRKRHKKYSFDNRIKIGEYGKKWREDNKDIINYKQRMKYYNNITYKLKQNIRRSILGSLKRNGYSKNSRTYEILGCSYEEFKSYIENQFEDWMSWDNHGKYNGQLNYGWDLDHIIPISSAQTEEEIIKLSHYTNFQPLCSKVNRDIKKDRIDYV